MDGFDVSADVLGLSGGRSTTDNKLARGRPRGTLTPAYTFESVVTCYHVIQFAPYATAHYSDGGEAHSSG